MLLHRCEVPRWHPRGPSQDSGLPPPKSSPGLALLGHGCSGPFLGRSWGLGSLPLIPCLTQMNITLSGVVPFVSLGGGGDEPFSISFHNSFLLLFRSFKCLLASNRSLSFYKCFCSPSCAACC